MSKKLVIRFDGPPSHKSGRFIEVELDGASVSYGEWEQDGDYWLLVLPDADAEAAQLETINADLLEACKEARNYLLVLAEIIQPEAMPEMVSMLEQAIREAEE